MDVTEPAVVFEVSVATVSVDVRYIPVGVAAIVCVDTAAEVVTAFLNVIDAVWVDVEVLIFC